MSFKRDGDDESLLKNLNHQRVRELLSNHIPQDEAKLLSNGRLSCMICVHRPIFDTINMLSIHRRGKRHMLELSKYIKCKEDAELKALQKKMSAHESSSLKKLTESTALTSYVPCTTILGAGHASAKQRNARKPILRMTPTLMANHSATQPILGAGSESLSNKKSASSTVRHYLKSMSRKKSLEKVIEKNRENYGEDLQKNTKSNDTSLLSKVAEKSTSTGSSRGGMNAVSQQENEALEYEMKLRMSGWIKDSLGKWIKDPNVEFDSDEEEMAPPNT